MGREIRKVPNGWKHPKDERGHYKPMYDEDYETAAKNWIAELLNWENGNDSNKGKYDMKYYWEWAGDPPDPEYYRPKFETEPACYQMYETVSEGTPASLVYETLEDMQKWLVEQGHTEHAAKQFIKEGWCPSFIMSNTCGVKANIDSFDCRDDRYDD